MKKAPTVIGRGYFYCCKLSAYCSHAFPATLASSAYFASSLALSLILANTLADKSSELLVVVPVAVVLESLVCFLR